MVKPPMMLDTIFCSARETARVSTLAKATMLVTSIPRVEATIRPSRMYSAAFVKDVIRLWAAFSSRDFSSARFTMFITARIARIPMTTSTTAVQIRLNSAP